MRSLLPFVLGLLVGGGLTWALGPAGSGPARSPPVDRPDPEAARPTDSPPSLRPPLPGPASAEPSSGAVAAPDPAPTARPATRAALIAARTEALRRQAADTVERARQLEAGAEEVAAQQVDAELAREAARLADEEHGGLLDLVQKLDEDWTPPVSLLSSRDALAAFFEPRRAGGRVGVERVNEAPHDVADGDVVQVPYGVWPLDVRSLTRDTRTSGFPHDLTFEGAGMDRSLLVLNDEFDVSADVVNLTFRDLTVDCNDNYFVQLRKGFTLRLERCRVIGFDMGAGGSTAFRGDRGALYATDSRIEAGFGDSPYRGNLWRVQGPFLARLERCAIVGPIGDVVSRSRSLVVYDQVTFVDLAPSAERDLRQHSEAARLLDCLFEHSEEGADRMELRRKRRSVSELNPAWRRPEGRR